MEIPLAKMPQLEEIPDDDIDNMDMDLAEFDPDLKTALAPKITPSVTKSTNYDEPPLFPSMPSASVAQALGQDNPSQIPVLDSLPEEVKTYQMVYPCYFDINRSHKEGRRVAKSRAVSNPLAKTILDACSLFGLRSILEPQKSHPQDFGNPGRVRVSLKSLGIKTKRELYNLVSAYLKKHETTPASVKELTLQGFDPELQNPSFIPRRLPKVGGFKMNDIVPLHSPMLMGHPQMKMVYEKEPEVVRSEGTEPVVPKMPKKKILKVRR